MLTSRDPPPYTLAYRMFAVPSPAESIERAQDVIGAMSVLLYGTSMCFLGIRNLPPSVLFALGRIAGEGLALSVATKPPGGADTLIEYSAQPMTGCGTNAI